ncbi:MAG: histidine kinase [Chitinophagaceae bacterium]|nr:histidine kinase [Chitinophagaceae bacterium]
MLKDPFLKWLIAPEKRLIRHLVTILSLAILIYSGDASEYPPHMFWILTSGALVMILLLPYLNMYWLVPRYLFKGRYIQYFLLVILSIFLFVVFFNYMGALLKRYQLNPQGAKEETVGSIIGFTIALGVLVAASTAVKLFQRWVNDNFRLARIENEKLNTELEQLKSQVNPHFLFNMLNNANVLTRTDPQKASEVLYSLSDLLRYQLYGCQADRVPLSSEVDFISNLLGLESVRRDRFSWQVECPEYLQNKMVPPLLFISFIENAVKHSEDPRLPSSVDVRIEKENDALIFQCTNTKPLQVPVHNGPSGIGLVNIRRRLNLLFPQSHQLQIQEQLQSYTVTLKLYV